MATAATIPPISVEQYLGFKGYPGLRDELINGEIVLSPQPKPHHQEIVENLHRLLGQAFEGSAYVVRQNSNIRFDCANSMPAPDLFVIDRESWRLAIASKDYLSKAPLLVIEVLSPANRARKVDEKAMLYLANGVARVWIVDLKLGKIFAATRNGDRIRKEEVERITIADPVAVTIEAPQVFAISI